MLNNKGFEMTQNDHFIIWKFLKMVLKFKVDDVMF